MSGWKRVNKHRRCPICGHADWCLVSNDESAAICPRVESDRYAGEAGWLHRLKYSMRGKHRPWRIVVQSLKVSPEKLTVLAADFQTAAKRLGKLDELAEELGLRAESLICFGVGWSARENCSTWPMCDAKGRVVGITRRFRSGSKKIMPGHRAGLYMPVDLPEDFSSLPVPLVVCEGASDAVTGMDLGPWTVGRFSCTHGSKLLFSLIKHRRPSSVVIVADRDSVGRRGAESLASTLLPCVPCLKVITPPTPHKDLRAWHQAGAGIEDLERVIGSAQPRQLKVTVRTA